MAKIYDRQNKKIVEENQYKEEVLNFLYNNLFGRILLKMWFITPIYSKIIAKRKNSKKSIKEIEPFIIKNNIKIDEFEDKKYISFNDFFIRKYKKENMHINKEKNTLISPAESKLLVYNIEKDLKVKIKGSIYSLFEIVKDNEIEKEFIDGKILIFRLGVNDYHRYISIDDGRLIKTNKIKGKLHTVSSISDKYKIYKENAREVNYLECSNLGKIIQIEVGAMQVGKIVNLKKDKFTKGEEKGYFEYGGSTIVVIIKKDKIEIDQDILENSKNGIETKIKIGEKIGEIK